MKKTVFFGPFFGELGWEFAYWHGWVRKMCKEKYQSYRKIVASYPGREPFYPNADEFWPHPPEITKLEISQRGYIADCWIRDLPEVDNQADISENIGQYAERLFKGYKERLPKDTIFYVPHKLNIYHLDRKQYLIGTLFLKGISFYKRPKTLSAPLEHQIFEVLRPTEKGEEFLNKLINSEKRIIAVFPRYRTSRRPDKSWPREKYDSLIAYLKKQYPDHIIGIFGAPGGCYYVDGVPSNCLDLINLPENLRFNIQVAALKRSDIAVGSESGGIHIALLAGCPTIEWGWAAHEKALEELNFLRTRLVFWPEINPSVETVENIISLMKSKREGEVVYPSFSRENWNRKEKELFIIRKINFGRIILREILSRIFLKYLKSKKLKEGVIDNKLILIQ